MIGALFTLVLAIPVAKPCPAAPNEERVTLSTGSSHRLIAYGTLRLSPPGIAKAERLDAREVDLIGLQAGTATLQIDTPGRPLRTVTIVVEKYVGCALVVSDLTHLFPCGSTLELRQRGDQVVLEGEASSVAEWRAAMDALEKHPGVVMAGHLKPTVIEQEFLAATAALAGAGVGRAHWTRAGDTALLEGEVPEERRPELLALEREWRPRLELVLRRWLEPKAQLPASP